MGVKEDEEEGKAITLEYRGKIAIITFELESKLNALTQALYYRLGVLLREVAGRTDVFVTVLTAKGRYFSAGADVSISRDLPPDTDIRRHWLEHFAARNLDLTRTFAQHPKILVTALNGPVIGLTAGLIALSDFIYATPDAFLLTPFSSMGLVAEGGASRSFVQRMGVTKANEALLMSKRISAREMLEVGFVNRIFEPEVGAAETTAAAAADKAWFLERVLKEVRENLVSDSSASGDEERLNGESLLRIKDLIRKPEREALESVNVAEVMSGLEMFAKGAPQREFMRLQSGQKRHKL
ncbi:MAG: hypothetical protein M1837_002526 [Sclerophora amabilis]|nr:MAG: hypothetical protein M1837_002526 [Sclerophora amabilis]